MLFLSTELIMSILEESQLHRPSFHMNLIDAKAQDDWYKYLFKRMNASFDEFAGADNPKAAVIGETPTQPIMRGYASHHEATAMEVDQAR
jgi:hypothetical protein